MASAFPPGRDTITVIQGMEPVMRSPARRRLKPAALKLPVTYVAFVPKKDKSWQHAVARGWTIRTFPGHHVAQQEDPRRVATLIEQSVSDRNE